MITLPWYKDIENALEPAHGVVTGLYVLVILICLFMLLQPSHTARTGFLVYLLSP